MTSYKSLVIEGYQSHRSTTIPFAPGLTVITGASGHGKTTIFRALKWLATGDPKGGDFLHTLRKDGEITYQSPEARVEVTTYDNIVVEKIRRKSKTMHRVSTVEKPFEKSETPKEVTEALGLQEYNFGDFSAMLNFAYQLDPPFLLSESPSAGAKVLGKLAGTEAVDKAIKSVNEDKYAVRQKRDKATTDVAEKETALLEYLFLDDAIKAYDTCKILMSQIEANENAIASLEALKEKLTKSETVIADCKEKAAKYENVDVAISLLSVVESSQSKQSTLSKLSADKTRVDTSVQALNKKLEIYGDLSAISSLLSSVSDKSSNLVGLEAKRNLYTRCVQSVDNITLKLIKLKNVDLASEMLQLVLVNYQKAIDIHRAKANHKAKFNLCVSLSQKLAQYKDLDTVHSLILKTEKTQQELNTLTVAGTKFTLLDKSVKNYEQSLTNYETAIENGQKELHDAWDAVGGVCPLCEQQVEH